MSKITVTSPVMQALFKELVKRCRSILNEEKDGLRLPTSVGPALYGYRTFSDEKNSIRAIMLRQPEVKVEIYAYNKEQIQDPDDEQELGDFFSGKYLYNRMREIDNGNTTVQLSGLYETIYFVFAGYSGIEDYLERNKDPYLSSDDTSYQRELLEMFREEISKSALRFLAYYFSYRENRIKRFLLEIDYLNNYKVRQTGFHFTSIKEGREGSKYFEKIEDSKVYTGQAIDLDNALQISLKGRKSNGKRNVVNIFLYKGGMSISNMNLVRGTLSTISSHGYIFSSEVFLKRVRTTESTVELLQSNFDVRDREALYIQRYLHLQRRTLRIPRSTEQDITKLSAKRYGLDTLDGLVGTWRIWGLDHSNGIVQSVMEVKSDYSAQLSTYGRIGDENQVCIFRLSEGGNSEMKLWISAHQEHGIELQNVALIRVPHKKALGEKLVEGVSIGVGFERFASTALLFIATENSIATEDTPRLQPKRMNDKGELATLLFQSTSQNIYTKAFKAIEGIAESRRVADDKFIKYSEIREYFNDHIVSSGN
ncbi:MAG: hypothetical protein AAFN81_04945 [Bacteroidota bacterium]